MKKLSALDLAFFLVESEGSPKHVAGLFLCGKPSGSDASFVSNLAQELRSHDSLEEPFNLVIRFIGLKGSKNEEMYPISTLAPGLRLNITLSNSKKLSMRRYSDGFDRFRFVPIHQSVI